MSGKISRKVGYADRDERPTPVSDAIIPSAPEWLNKRAKKIFKKTASQIVALGIGGSFDTNVVAQYSSIMDTFQTMEEEAAADPTLRMKCMNQSIKMHAMILQLTKELGLSPLSRAKLRIAKTEEKKLTEDDLTDE